MTCTEGQGEKRAYPRTDRQLVIRMVDTKGNMIVETKTVNVSESGLFLYTTKDIAPAIGSRVILQICLEPAHPTGGPGGGADVRANHLTSQATIVRHEVREDGLVGIGLKFEGSVPALRPETVAAPEGL